MKEFNSSESYGYFKELRYIGASNSWRDIATENVILICEDYADFNSNYKKIDITQFHRCKVIIWGITPQMEIPTFTASAVHRTPNGNFYFWVECVRRCKRKLPMEEDKKLQKESSPEEPFIGEIVPNQFY